MICGEETWAAEKGWPQSTPSGDALELDGALALACAALLVLGDRIRVNGRSAPTARWTAFVRMHCHAEPFC